jgi:hypothetical protein
LYVEGTDFESERLQSVSETGPIAELDEPPRLDVGGSVLHAGPLTNSETELLPLDGNEVISETGPLIKEPVDVPTLEPDGSVSDAGPLAADATRLYPELPSLGAREIIRETGVIAAQSIGLRTTEVDEGTTCLEPLSDDEINTESERMLSATDVKTGPLDEEQTDRSGSFDARRLICGAESACVARYEAVSETDSLGERRPDSAAGPMTWLTDEGLDSDITSYELPEKAIVPETGP